jgi:hypothetical protein
MEGMTGRKPSLSDPQQAALAWRRYRRLMGWMTLAAALSVLGALAYLQSTLGALPLPIILATIAGVGLSVLLAAALMGLVFLSSGTGHDQDVVDFEEEK